MLICWDRSSLLWRMSTLCSSRWGQEMLSGMQIDHHAYCKPQDKNRNLSFADEADDCGSKRKTAGKSLTWNRRQRIPLEELYLAFIWRLGALFDKRGAMSVGHKHFRGLLATRYHD